MKNVEAGSRPLLPADIALSCLSFMVFLLAFLVPFSTGAQRPAVRPNARERVEMERTEANRQREAERALSLVERQRRMAAARSALADYGALRGTLPDRQRSMTPALDLTRSDVVEAESAPVYFIPADRLAQYRASQEVLPLLRATGQRSYPVLSDGRAQVAVMIEQGAVSWEPSEYGSPELAERIHAAWSGVPGSTGAVSVIRIPALDLEFVGLTGINGLELIPVSDAPRLGLRAGARLNAATTLAALAARAREVRAPPR